jgi:hypothetical protein
MQIPEVWLLPIGIAIGLVIGLALRFGLRTIGARGGSLGGTWEQTLQDGRGGTRAKDRVVCRQSGNELRGTIRRVEPTVEDYKEWRFSGRVDGPLISCVYWGADPQRTPGEAGTLQLALLEPGRGEGFQVRRQTSQDGARFIATSLETKLIWSRQ